MNLATITNPKGLSALKEAIVNNGPYGSPTEPAKDLTSRLRAIVLEVNGGESNISIPYASAVLAFKDKYVVQLLEDIKTSQTEVLSKRVKAARDEYLKEVSSDEIPFAPGYGPGEIPPLSNQELRAARIARFDTFKEPGVKFATPNSRGTIISKQGVRKGASISERADSAFAATLASGQLGPALRLRQMATAAPVAPANVLTRTPARGRPASEWTEWAVTNNVPLPHTKKSLLERY